MRIAMLGGSFNPLHLGHLLLADEVCCKLKYDCVLFVPAWDPPHKYLAPGASSDDRLQMLKDALFGIKNFALEDCEIRRKGVSYTIDTIKYLQEKYSASISGKIGLIIGDDLLDGFSSWSHPDELALITDIIVANRLNKTDSSVCDFPYPHICVSNSVFPVSSSDIRNRIFASDSWRFFVPESVYCFIKKNKLYGFKENENAVIQYSKTNDIVEIIERVRKYAMASEKIPRYEHSVRTAETAAKLCRLYGIDSILGYLAGIAHDICKEMNGDLLMSVAGRDGKPLEKIEQEKPSLLHGRAAAMLLQTDFGIQNQDVLEAVRNHTFGKPGMCDLAKILYVADKIEPGRPHVTTEYLKKLFELSLDELVRTVLQENIDFLVKKGKDVAPISMRFLLSLGNAKI